MTQIDHPFSRLPMVEFIPALSPSFSSPFHLADWLALIERANREAIRGLCSIPIRHWKTESTVHGIIWLLLQDPSRRIMFLTHSFDAAKKWGKRIRQLAEAMDHIIGKHGTVGPTRGWNEIAEWRNDSGGGVVVMSADQSKIGYDCHILIVDDAIDEHGAKDPTKREEVDQSITFYGARCVRDGSPGPILLVASRFHPDDPTGRRIARTAVTWIYVKHAAIERHCVECGGVVDANVCLDHPMVPTEERAFAPDVLSLEALRGIKEELKESDPNETVWHAQFQNDPQPEGSDFFGSPTLYTELPTFGYRLGHGVDFAYVDAPGTDFFAAVHARIYGRKMYVIEIQRHKLDATLLETTCRDFMDRHGRAPFWSYQSGPEIGMSRMLIQRGIPIGILKAKYNKLVRAQKTIRRWNDGDILLPERANWRAGFQRRASLFRGHDKDRDDEIDALVSLSDAMLGGAVASPASISGGRKPYPGMM